jgi:hypothetical protein
MQLVAPARTNCILGGPGAAVCHLLTTADRPADLRGDERPEQDSNLRPTP